MRETFKMQVLYNACIWNGIAFHTPQPVRVEISLAHNLLYGQHNENFVCAPSAVRWWAYGTVPSLLVLHLWFCISIQQHKVKIFLAFHGNSPKYSVKWCNLYLCQATVDWEMPDRAYVLRWMRTWLLKKTDIFSLEHSRMLHYSEERTQIDVQLSCCCTCC